MLFSSLGSLGYMAWHDSFQWAERLIMRIFVGVSAVIVAVSFLCTVRLHPSCHTRTHTKTPNTNFWQLISSLNLFTSVAAADLASSQFELLAAAMRGVKAACCLEVFASEFRGKGVVVPVVSLVVAVSPFHTLDTSIEVAINMVQACFHELEHENPNKRTRTWLITLQKLMHCMFLKYVGSTGYILDLKSRSSHGTRRPRRPSKTSTWHTMGLCKRVKPKRRHRPWWRPLEEFRSDLILFAHQLTEWLHPLMQRYKTCTLTTPGSARPACWVYRPFL